MHDARHHDTATPRHHAEEIALLTSFCSSGGSFLVAMPSFPANDFHMSDLTPTVPRFISSTTQQHACMVTSASRQAGSSPFGIGRPDQRHRNLISACPSIWRLPCASESLTTSLGAPKLPYQRCVCRRNTTAYRKPPARHDRNSNKTLNARYDETRHADSRDRPTQDRVTRRRFSPE
jgi:hypothetical protein